MQRHVAQFAVVRYGVAVFCVTATVIVALWLRPIVLAAAQLLLVAILITGWVSGLRPALVAWVLATLALAKDSLTVLHGSPLHTSHCLSSIVRAEQLLLLHRR